MRKKILCSCSLKEFLTLMESKISVKENGESDEREIVRGFLDTLNEELPDVTTLYVKE